MIFRNLNSNGCYYSNPDIFSSHSPWNKLRSIKLHFLKCRDSCFLIWSQTWCVNQIVLAFLWSQTVPRFQYLVKISRCFSPSCYGCVLAVVLSSVCSPPGIQAEGSACAGIRGRWWRRENDGRRTPERHLQLPLGSGINYFHPLSFDQVWCPWGWL